MTENDINNRKTFTAKDLKAKFELLRDSTEKDKESKDNSREKELQKIKRLTVISPRISEAQAQLTDAIITGQMKQEPGGNRKSIYPMANSDTMKKLVKQTSNPTSIEKPEVVSLTTSLSSFELKKNRPKKAEASEESRKRAATYSANSTRSKELEEEELLSTSPPKLTNSISEQVPSLSGSEELTQSLSSSTSSVGQYSELEIYNSWQPYHTDEGIPYFYSPILNESIWEMPPAPTTNNLQSSSEPIIGLNTEELASLTKHYSPGAGGNPARKKAATLFIKREKDKPNLVDLLPDDYIQVPMLISADCRDFITHINAIGNTLGSQTLVTRTIDNKPIKFAFSAAPTDSVALVDQMSNVPRNASVFLFVTSPSNSKDLKNWKNDLVKAKHRTPTILVVTPKGGAYKTKSAEILAKIDAVDMVEYDTATGDGISEILESIYKASVPVKKDKKDMKMLRRMTLRKLRPMDSDFDEEEEDDKEKEKKDHDLKKKRDSGAQSPILVAPVAKSKPKKPITDPQDYVIENLTQLLDRGSRGEEFNAIDMKVLKSLLFGYSEKLIRKCQEKVHKHAAEASGLSSKGIFSRSGAFKISKYHFTFGVKKEGLNLPIYDSFTITNNWNVKAKYKFVNNYYFSSDVFVSFYPPSGEIEKGKTVTINLGCVAYNKIKLQEVFLLDLTVHTTGNKDEKEKTFFERFYLPVSVEAEEPSTDPNAIKYWEVDHTMVDTLKSIGAGASAGVFLCSLWGVEVALKKWEFGRLDSPPIDFHRELQTIMDLRHSNVVGFVGAITQTPAKACIITEYLENGGLDKVLKDHSQNISFSTRMKMALDVNRGMSFMHSKGVMHRDLKSLNLLVDRNLNVKVADFGEARDMNNFMTLTKGIGTYLWIAPEVVNCQTYSFAADVFSFGLVLWELYTRKLPERDMDEVRKGICPAIPHDCPPEYASIIKICTSYDPEKRPTFKQTMEMLEMFYKQISEEDDKKLNNELAKLPDFPRSASNDDYTDENSSMTSSITHSQLVDPYLDSDTSPVNTNQFQSENMAASTELSESGTSVVDLSNPTQ